MKKKTYALLYVLLAMSFFTACGQPDNSVPTFNEKASVETAPMSFSGNDLTNELLKIGYVDEDEFHEVYGNLSGKEKLKRMENDGIIGTMLLNDDMDPSRVNGCKQVLYYNISTLCMVDGEPCFPYGDSLVYLKFDSSQNAADAFEELKGSVLSDNDMQIKNLDNSIVIAEATQNTVTSYTRYWRISQNDTAILYYETTDFYSPYDFFEDDLIYKMFDRFGF